MACTATIQKYQHHMTLNKVTSSEYSPIDTTPRSNILSDRESESSSDSSSSVSYNEEIKYFNPYVPSAIFHRKSNSEFDNPYSNSLWYYTRGNDGEEIRKIEERRKTMRALSGGKKEVLDRSKSEINRRTSNKATFAKETTTSLKTRSHSLRRVKKQGLGLVISEPFSPLDPLYQKEKRPLQDLIPSLELESICKAGLHHLELLASLKQSLNEYLEQNVILMNQKHKRLLFGNNETMNSVYKILYQKIKGKQQINIEVINDYLSRALRVYPSYIFHRSQRRFVVEKMVSEKSQKFEGWLASIKNILLVDGYTNLEEALTAPVGDLEKMINFFQNNLNTSEPADVSALNKITRLRGYINSQNLRSSERSTQTEDELPFFEIPATWKTQNKQKWREMSRYSAEDQSIMYLRSEIQASMAGFKIWYKQLKTKCLDEIECIIRNTIHIATIFNNMSQDVMESSPGTIGISSSGKDMTPRTELFYENSVGSTYQMYLNKCEREKQQVSMYLLKFEVSMNSRNTLFTGYVKEVLDGTKSSEIKNIESKMSIITSLSKLLECMKQYEMMTFARFILALKSFTAAPLADSARSVSGWHEMQAQEIICRFNSMRKTHKAILRDMYSQQSSVESLSRRIGASAATEKVLDILK